MDDYSWSDLDPPLSKLAGIKTERKLLKELEKNFSGPSRWIGLIPSKKKGKCTEVLLVICSSSNFSKRALAALSVIDNCNKDTTITKGILFLPLNWSLQAEDSLEQVAHLLKNRGVLSVGIKFPLNTKARNILN